MFFAAANQCVVFDFLTCLPPRRSCDGDCGPPHVTARGNVIRDRDKFGLCNCKNTSHLMTGQLTTRRELK